MITVKLNEESKEKPFPKLMKFIHDDMLVYFIKDGVGLPITGLDGWDNNTDGWNMEAFTDYNEPITLQNA